MLLYVSEFQKPLTSPLETWADAATILAAVAAIIFGIVNVLWAKQQDRIKLFYEYRAQYRSKEFTEILWKEFFILGPHLGAHVDTHEFIGPLSYPGGEVGRIEAKTLSFFDEVASLVAEKLLDKERVIKEMKELYVPLWNMHQPYLQGTDEVDRARFDNLAGLVKKTNAPTQSIYDSLHAVHRILEKRRKD